jgi:hypothetical protein
MENILLLYNITFLNKLKMICEHVQISELSSTEKVPRGLLL